MVPDKTNRGWQCRLDRAWCYVPAVIGWVLFGLLLGLSLVWATEGELRRVKPRQVLDGMLIWFCAGPVIIGTIRGWRKTLRRRLRSALQRLGGETAVAGHRETPPS